MALCSMVNGLQGEIVKYLVETACDIPANPINEGLQVKNNFSGIFRWSADTIFY